MFSGIINIHDKHNWPNVYYGKIWLSTRDLDATLGLTYMLTMF